ncbi:molybdopterin molybdotransferase MoeA [Salinarimonas soli]|uniref:Molybdopterin molybdenumtransferase n=1 Tax=Salinarimonas soli TaxID=1638099 RepID=A0A5B2VG84_9HYPH|nr:gephyrin-like molybdotransferase Glp [Salinarimonas soli]KAA2237167.1 molybdopterin molybdotransferase MoeA [Salinarimonas soli]
MAQLSDDCFAFGGALMSLNEATALIRERVAPVAEPQTVPLHLADGRVLADAIAAPLDLPPFDNSAVDGYAVRFQDLAPAGDTVLPVSGRLAAGRGIEGSPMPKAALRIFTGAPMPPGFDTVFMQEDTREEGGRVVLPSGLKAGANRRPAGEDVAQGAAVLPAGRRLRPQDVALLAALGIAEVPVRRRLRVAVFSTGDEIVSPGEPLGPASLYDSNRFTLLALLSRLSCQVTDLGILPDARDAVAGALREAASGHDLLITSGGVSTGEEDHVKAAVEAAGGLSFWRVAIKPGRPVALGTVAGTPFIGLPGNPVAVFVTFARVARALVAQLSGEAWEPAAPFPVRSDFAYKKKEGRREYVRVRLMRAADGALVASKHPREGAGVITSMTETDGLAELPEGITRVAPGDTLAFLPYAALI